MPAAVVIGLSVGAEVDRIGDLVARYFGMHAYVQIYGRRYAGFLVATGLGPVIFGASRDASNSYTPSLCVAAVFILASVTLFAKLPRFQPSP